MIITAGVRDRLKRVLSPHSFRVVCEWWWLGKFYLLRRVFGTFVKRKPTVYGKDSELTSQLRTVNAFAPTSMCRVMTHYGSDKGNGWHNYTSVYSKLFRGWKNRDLRMMELGLGTNNPQLASSMGVDGRPGASLRGWRDIFPKAQVFGADIDKTVLFKEERIETFFCDQTNPQAVENLWSEPVLSGGMDIIIDDGLHRFAANCTFLDGSLRHLREGGYYIIEDIRNQELPSWYEQLPLYANKYPQYMFALLALPNKLNNFDNNMVVIKNALVRT